VEVVSNTVMTKAMAAAVVTKGTVEATSRTTRGHMEPLGNSVCAQQNSSHPGL
jgi:hypothetical protein